MPYFTANAQDRKGNAIGSATVTVSRVDGGVVALWVDLANTVVQPNPLTTDENGRYSFFSASGLYSFIITKTGLDTQTFTYELVSSSGSSSPVINAIDFGFVDNGVTDNAAAFTALNAAYVGTGKKVYFPGGGLGYAAHGRITVDGFGIYGDQATKFLMLDKLSRALFMESDDVSVESIQLICPPCRRYRLSSITQAGGANTAVTCTILQADLDDPDLGAHSFVAGNSVRLQNVVLTAGSFNDTALTISSVTANTIVFSTGTRTIDTSIVYPFDRLDGLGVSLYPSIQLARSAATADMGLVISCNNYLVKDVLIKWGSCAGLMHSYSQHGKIERVHVYHTAADGINWTGTVDDSDCFDCEVEGSGDDGAAIIGYMNSAAFPTNIRIRGLRVHDNHIKGRGLSFIGCSNVRVWDYDAYNVTGAGLLFYADPNLPCYGNHNIIVDGYTLKGCGQASSNLPTGWAATGIYGAIQFTGGVLPQVENRNITLKNGHVFASRNSCFVGNSIVQHEIHIDGLTIDGNTGNAVDALGSFPCKNSTFKRIRINHAQGPALSLTAGGLGLNKYEDVLIKNPNRGYPRPLATASSTTTSITLTLKPRQTGAFISSKVISSLTHVGTLATAVVTSTTDLVTGYYLEMRGSSEGNWNVYREITVTSPTTFTFAIQSGVSATAPGGPLTCGQNIIVQGITNNQFTGSTAAIRAAEIAADYALNNRAGMNEYWFLDTVTPAGVPATQGDVLTITPVPTAISSITRVGTVATATVASTEFMKDGMYVRIAGATGADGTLYNVWKTIGILSSTQFNYTMTGTPTGSAAGTLTWTYINTSSVPACNTLSNPEPDAYVSTREGLGGDTDAVIIDGTITDKLLLKEFTFVEALWVCQRVMDISATTADQITVRETNSQLAPNLVPTAGTGVIAYEPRVRTIYGQAIDAGDFVPAAAMRYGYYLRTIATAPVTDAWPTAAQIGREFMALSHVSHVYITCGNLGASAMTMGTATGVTLSGSMVVAVNTEVDFAVHFTDVRPGYEACTISRTYGRAIVA